MDCLKKARKLKGRICDFALLWKHKPRVTVIEMKGGQVLKIGQLVEQLQMGLDALDGLLGGQNVGEFVPILLFAGKKNPGKALRSRRVTFRGQKRLVLPAPCGSQLSTILKN